MIKLITWMIKDGQLHLRTDTKLKYTLINNKKLHRTICLALLLQSTEGLRIAV